MPYRIAFDDQTSIPLIILDTCIDFLFILDILINFFSAYEDPKIGLEVRHSKIAVKYLASWFPLDIISW
jgi:hypothetical protein